MTTKEKYQEIWRELENMMEDDENVFKWITEDLGKWG